MQHSLRDKASTFFVRPYDRDERQVGRLQHQDPHSSKRFRWQAQPKRPDAHKGDQVLGPMNNVRNGEEIAKCERVDTD